MGSFLRHSTHVLPAWLGNRGEDMKKGDHPVMAVSSTRNLWEIDILYVESCEGNLSHFLGYQNTIW